MQIKFMAVAAVICLASAAQAATFPASISREPLMRGNVSDRLSIGLGYDRIKRGVKFSGGLGEATVDADSITGYVGYNMQPWLTAFVTAGGSSLRGEWESSDYGLRLSLGMNAYFWEADVLSPDFAAGRVSIKGTVEIARHETRTNAGDSDWVEVIAALPIGYELFDRYPTTKSGVSTSLALYAGPAVSVLDGNLALAPGVKRGFSQDQLFGAVAGADVFFAPSVSLGVSVLIFDEVSTGASLRFHF